MSPSDAFRRRRTASFLQIAGEELEAARTLAAVLPRQAAFFQQQCVEKLLRAILEHADVPAGPSHNLRTLVDLLAKDSRWRNRFLAFEELSSSATRYRYPSGSGDAPKVSAAQVQTRMAEIENLLGEVKSFVQTNPIG